MLLFLLVGVDVRVEALDELVEGWVRAQGAPRCHLDPALRAFFLAEAQVLLNALLAEAVHALHESVCHAHNRQADRARQLRVEKARRNARTVIGVHKQGAPGLVDAPDTNLARLACTGSAQFDELAVPVSVPVPPLAVIFRILVLFAALLVVAGVPIAVVLFFSFAPSLPAGGSWGLRRDWLFHSC